jgi:phosphoenolpyruvate carboxylase
MPKAATAHKHSRRKRSAKSGRATRKWSGRVTAKSDALDLKKDVFKLSSPSAIARSLKRSAEHSHRRKSDPYRSAMSILVFYINRAGSNLPQTRRRKLEAAKDELRKAFGRS